MFCYSDDVDKKLKYDEYISISLTDSHAPIQKNSVVPKKRHPKFGDPLETILMEPLQSVICASTTEPKMTPTNHHFNKYSSSQVQPWSSRFAMAPPKP